jgi:hypothetical protein
MKASELRIGNYIDYTTEREIVTMQTTYEYIRLIHNGNKNFKPIKLTEDWLLKFGFKYSLRLDDFMFKDKNDIFEMQPYKKGFLNSVLWCDNEILQELKYVHQLQNLYFALTGEELSL